MSLLFSPYKLKNLELANRIMVSPMCQYSAENGAAGAWHMIHLGTLAFSGAGMLCLEATAVEPEGRITPGDLGLWDDTTEDALKPIIAAIRKYSPTAIAMQVAHAGRKASCHLPWKGGAQISPSDQDGWQTFAPSNLPYAKGENAPAALDKSGLDRIRNAFVDTAQRAARLGLDALEVHAAHGYLLHQFLSPLSNRRDDEYGGSLENRLRFPLEVFDAVRANFPADKPVGIRVSATDWIEGGWEIEQTIAFVQELKQRGVDWVDVSTGGLSPLQTIPLSPGYQLPFAEAVKSATGVNTIGVGLITNPQQAEEAIASGKADMIALARSILYDPRWPWHAAAELGASISAPPQYWPSQPYEHKNLFIKN